MATIRFVKPPNDNKIRPITQDLLDDLCNSTLVPNSSSSETENETKINASKQPNKNNDTCDLFVTCKNSKDEEPKTLNTSRVKVCSSTSKIDYINATDKNIQLTRNTSVKKYFPKTSTASNEDCHETKSTLATNSKVFTNAKDDQVMRSSVNEIIPTVMSLPNEPDHDITLSTTVQTNQNRKSSLYEAEQIFKSTPKVPVSQNFKSQVTKSIPNLNSLSRESAQNIKHLTTVEVYQKPKCLQEVPQNPKSLQEVQQNTQSLQEVHQNTQSLQEVHQNTQTLPELHQNIKSSSEAHKNTFTSHEVHQNIHNTKSPFELHQNTKSSHEMHQNIKSSYEAQLGFKPSQRTRACQNFKSLAVKVNPKLKSSSTEHGQHLTSTSSAQINQKFNLSQNEKSRDLNVQTEQIIKLPANLQLGQTLKSTQNNINQRVKSLGNINVSETSTSLPIINSKVNSKTTQNEIDMNLKSFPNEESGNLQTHGYSNEVNLRGKLSPLVQADQYLKSLQHNIISPPNEIRQNMKSSSAIPEQENIKSFSSVTISSNINFNLEEGGKNAQLSHNFISQNLKALPKDEVQARKLPEKEAIPVCKSSPNETIRNLETQLNDVGLNCKSLRNDIGTNLKSSSKETTKSIRFLTTNDSLESSGDDKMKKASEGSLQDKALTQTNLRTIKSEEKYVTNNRKSEKITEKDSTKQASLKILNSPDEQSQIGKDCNLQTKLDPGEKCENSGGITMPYTSQKTQQPENQKKVQSSINTREVLSFFKSVSDAKYYGLDKEDTKTTDNVMTNLQKQNLQENYRKREPARPAWEPEINKNASVDKKLDHNDEETIPKTSNGQQKKDSTIGTLSETTTTTNKNTLSSFTKDKGIPNDRRNAKTEDKEPTTPTVKKTSNSFCELPKSLTYDSVCEEESTRLKIGKQENPISLAESQKRQEQKDSEKQNQSKAQNTTTQSETLGKLSKKGNNSKRMSDVPSFFRSINDAKYYGLDTDDTKDTDNMSLNLSEMNPKSKNKKKQKENSSFEVQSPTTKNFSEWEHNTSRTIKKAFDEVFEKTTVTQNTISKREKGESYCLNEKSSEKNKEITTASKSSMNICNVFKEVSKTTTGDFDNKSGQGFPTSNQGSIQIVSTSHESRQPQEQQKDKSQDNKHFSPLQEKLPSGEAQNITSGASQGKPPESNRSFNRSISNSCMIDVPSFFRSINDAKYYGLDKEKEKATDVDKMKFSSQDSYPKDDSKGKQQTKTAWEAVRESNGKLNDRAGSEDNKISRTEKDKNKDKNEEKKFNSDGKSSKTVEEPKNSMKNLQKCSTFEENNSNLLEDKKSSSFEGNKSQKDTTKYSIKEENKFSKLEGENYKTGETKKSTHEEKKSNVEHENKYSSYESKEFEENNSNITEGTKSISYEEKKNVKLTDNTSVFSEADKSRQMEDAERSSFRRSSMVTEGEAAGQEVKIDRSRRDSNSTDRLKMRRCALADPGKMIMSQEQRERIEKEVEKAKGSVARKVTKFINVQLGLSKEEDLN